MLCLAKKCLKCKKKSAGELSLRLHEITQTVDSLQRQRTFWMWCPISQLFSVNYQPTTCQTLTVKMSATKISPSQKRKRSNEMCWAKGRSLQSCVAVPTGRFVPQTWCSLLSSRWLPTPPPSVPQRSPHPSGTVVYFNVLLRPTVEMSECAPTELPVAAAPQQEGFN